MLLVLSFHGRVPGFAGGYLGVDVFFVLSGYLITGGLVLEYLAKGTISLSGFWARRIRRLMPASAVVFLATLPLALWRTSPIYWDRVLGDFRSAILYYSNVRLSLRSEDYFAVGSGESFFLHSWSLSVEEQFYLVWPIAFLGAAVACRRTKQPRRIAVVLVSAGAVASFALNVALVKNGMTWAFFSSPSRAWEFAAGALTALAGTRHLTAVASRVLSFVGAAMIISALAVAGGDSPSSILNVMAVLGTALVVLGGGGEHVTQIQDYLGASSLGGLGRLSYAIYLWHWPVFLAMRLREGTVEPFLVVAGVVVSIGLAWATMALVETPLRYGSALGTNGRAVRFLVVVSAFAWLLSIGLGLISPLRTDQYLQRVAAARDDRVNVKGCSFQADSPPPSTCVFGDITAASRTVLLLGDSHAMHWIPALDIAGKELGFRLVYFGVSSCPAVPVPILRKHVRYGDCDAIHDKTEAVAKMLKPLIVVAGSSSGQWRAVYDAASDSERDRIWADAVKRLAHLVGDVGARFVLLQDNPRWPFDPIDCLAINRDPAQCSVPVNQTDSLPARVRRVEEDALRGGSSFYVDGFAMVCPTAPCEVEQNGRLVYWDRTHLTRAYSESLAHHFVDALRPVLIDAPGDPVSP